jgi:EmrB/QacA subfamily drug resistance transporter
MEYSKRERSIVLLACCMSVLIAPMTGTMANLSLKFIGADMGVGTHDLGWVSTIFFLASVLALVPLSKVADIHGKRKVMAIGLMIMAVGSLSCGLSPNYQMLLASRMLTGIGTAAIMCTGVSMLADVYPAQSRGKAFGINTASVYLGLSMGPLVGGVVVDVLGWRSVFFIMVPITLFTLVPLLLFKGDFRPSSGKKLDVKGSAMYIAAMALALYGLTMLPDPLGIPCLAAGVALIAMFGRMMLRSEDPVLDVGIFRNSVFSRSMVALFFNYASSFMVAFFCALYFQGVCGMSATSAGLMLIVQTAIQCALSPFFGRISDRTDPRLLPTAGMLITATGLSMVATFGEGTDLLFAGAAFAVLGIGFAMFTSPNTNVIMSSVGLKDYSAASAMIALFRQVGSVASMAMAMAFVALIMGSLDVLDETTIPAFIQTMHVSFAVCVVLCIVGAGFSWFRGSSPEADVR